MGACFLRIEGVNLDNFVYDVHDLSTTRGGGLLLLHAIERVQREFSLKPVTTGASSGLFLAEASDPEKLRGSVAGWLRAEEDLRHATFVVDVLPDEGNGYVYAREALTAMNRWGQWQQPTLSVPATNQSAKGVCEFDRVRPAAKKVDEGRAISASVAARRDYGRREKQRFYANELRELPRDPAVESLLEWLKGLGTAPFTSDLGGLTGSAEHGSLGDKMAVVYFDGNKFGDLQRSLCTTPELQSEFDAQLKLYRRTALRVLLEACRAGGRDWVTADEKDKKVRLETLLWGGDELIWVVPAWAGWQTVALFYEISHDWAFHDVPLTHAGGVVFCHHNAPIHKVTDLARGLANLVKYADRAEPTTHQRRDRFAYQVLESFDYIPGDLGEFRKTRVPKGRDASELIVSGAGMGASSALFTQVKRGFPRSKLHEIVRLLHEEEDDSVARRTIDGTRASMTDDSRTALDELLPRFGPPGSLTPWFHLAELWDYALEGGVAK